MAKTYLKKNLNLLRYVLGLWLLGSVAWMPWYHGVKKYYMLSQIAEVWLIGFGFLFVTVFSASTLLAMLSAFFPFKSWTFDRKFYRFFLVFALILIPLFSLYLFDNSPIEISAMLHKLAATDNPHP